ncbi:helix-turn-helix domain-containing protein [Streptomyces collinus]
MLTAVPESAEHLFRRVLGELETAEPEITEAVRVFIAAQCNVSRAADRLYVHRKTRVVGIDLDAVGSDGRFVAKPGVERRPP